MEASRYPNPKGKYFIFRFDEEVSIDKFDLKKRIGIHRLSHTDYQDDVPIFPTGTELLKYKL
ncbi:MAG: hypothetical protein K2H04_03000 [Bacteroidaceae bacterium]|nr:hypothetical protein [Bacteroidaceae bacterium]